MFRFPSLVRERPAMTIDFATTAECKEEDSEDVAMYMRGVKTLLENGITRVPPKYILPQGDRPTNDLQHCDLGIRIPVIDLSGLHTEDHAAVLSSIGNACSVFGFFQVVNHGVDGEVVREMMDMSKRFFDMSYEERAAYMSPDIRSSVRYGTSFNPQTDGSFTWRDFLKLNCQPLDAMAPLWPSSPLDLREKAEAYARSMKELFTTLMKGILDVLGVQERRREMEKDLSGGSHLMVVNCFPPCPQPQLTLGMPPHSDYGFLTLLLQDDVPGLQIHHDHCWITIPPVPNSFFVIVGDHLEILSNGRFKSALHRVHVNSSRSRNSIASFHSFPFERAVAPADELVDEKNPRRYVDTDFATFLDFLASKQYKGKSFLASRSLDTTDDPRTN